MFRNTIISILNESWPMMLICLVIIISMRLVYIIQNKIKITFYKEILKLGFIIYVMCLFYVVTFQDVSWSTSNLIPFKEIFRYELGTKLFFKNVIGNVLIFVPFGFFVSYFLNIMKPYIIILLTFLVSITIELTQYKIGRVFDVDDIILNLLGGLIGFLICYLIHKFEDKIPNVLKKPFVYNILIIVVLIVMFLYLGGFYV